MSNRRSTGGPAPNTGSKEEEVSKPAGAAPVPPLLTLSDVGERLKLGHTSIDLLVRRGKLRVIRFGRAVRVTEAALALCIAEMEAEADRDRPVSPSIAQRVVEHQKASRVRQ